MTDCKLCKHAKWKKAASGSLHPSGDGQCMYEVKIPDIPASKWWSGHMIPSTTLGFISRRTPTKVECKCFESATNAD